MLGADVKGKATKEVVLAAHCAEVAVRAKKPRPLFDFKRQSFENKLRTLGRCGINEVIVSAPLGVVGGTHFKPEGCHVQMWIALLEQVFPELIGYNVELLEVLMPEDMESKELRKTLEAEVQESIRRKGRRLFPVHCPQQPEQPDGHWILLSLERRDDESPMVVRYFDTLDVANEVCVSRANKLLH